MTLCVHRMDATNVCYLCSSVEDDILNQVIQVWHEGEEIKTVFILGIPFDNRTLPKCFLKACDSRHCSVQVTVTLPELE